MQIMYIQVVYRLFNPDVLLIESDLLLSGYFICCKVATEVTPGSLS
jgi:hypothetical protein